MSFFENVLGMFPLWSGLLLGNLRRYATDKMTPLALAKQETPTAMWRDGLEL